VPLSSQVHRWVQQNAEKGIGEGVHTVMQKPSPFWGGEGQADRNTLVYL